MSLRIRHAKTGRNQSVDVEDEAVVSLVRRVVQGTARFHASPSEAGGQTRRGFCPDCGAPIYGLPDAAPQIVAIRAASLDDPSWFSPQVDVWTSDAHPWDQMNAALPKFEKYPPMG